MSDARRSSESENLFELTRLIRRHLRRQNEVVLATCELQGFLGNGQPLDSVTVQETIRAIAADNRWEAFVFDYGALVRFTKASNGRSRGH